MPIRDRPPPDADLAARLLEASPGILIRAVEQMSLGITVSDRDGRIVYTNRAEAEMHGYTREELIGRSVRELGEPSATGGMPGETTGGETPPPSPWVRNRTNRRKDGSVFPVRLISDEIRDGEGDLLGRVTISEDISERARLERMKEEFITVVGHELRTPLTSIRAALSLLRKDCSTSDRSRRSVEIAERNAEHLLELVHELLDLQSAVLGKLAIEPEPVEVRALLDEAAARAAEGRSSRSGELRKRIMIGLDRHDLQVRADRGRLLQVIDHLLANALSFSPPTEPVHLDAIPGPEETMITVSDRGPGIPAELQRRLFEPFAQADTSTTRPNGGPGPSLGLGLTLSKALVEAMGGTIEIAHDASRNPGVDPPETIVRVRLPTA